MRRIMAGSLAALFLNAGWVNAAQFFDHNEAPTATPIKHIVVIFQENVSFDHYFGTYPHALNPSGEPAFHAKPGTPTINGLTGTLLTSNPNASNPDNGAGATNPFRLSRAQAATPDQDHDYKPEQLAFHNGLMDLFPMSVGVAGPPPSPPPAILDTKGITMGYYDGNTVTALWNYAQHFAMSDNSYGTTFGPSTPGALNLISGQTNGVKTLGGGVDPSANEDVVADGSGSYTVIGDPDALGDVCSSTEAVTMSGLNIGDLLNQRGISWGWFNGGFDLTITNPNGTTGCSRSTTSAVTAQNKKDYSAHHQAFQYYKSTSNPTHTRPTSVTAIGHQGDAANHQYDLNDFYTAVKAHNFPAVSFLKAQSYQDGHAGYSDPLDEQAFIVHVINFLQQQPEWINTAVVIAYDDSDGWYDHQIGPIVNQSTTVEDALTGDGQCGNGATALPGVAMGTLHAQGRCGYGPRLPMLVISPWSKRNFVDHTVTDQSSVIHFIEDNWLGGKRIGQGSFDGIANSISSMFDFDHPLEDALLTGPLFLNENTGQPIGR